MHTDNFPLTESSHTGFPYPQEKESIIQSIIPFALGIPLALGTGATQPDQYHWPGQWETIITEIQLKEGMVDAPSITTGFPEMLPAAHEQLSRIKQIMGLNILEIAAILQVSRPTVYDWLESKQTRIHKENQNRLNSIYAVCKTWEANDLGCLGSHLHKPAGTENVSLFDLLKSDSLNMNEINRYLDNIAKLISRKRQEDQAHEALLKKHGFEPTSKEEIEYRLNYITFLD